MNFKELRNPWKVFGKNLFGFWLPFIGFEDIEITADDFEEYFGRDVPKGQQTVIGQLFTVEWFNKGISIGGFKLGTED